MRVPRENDKHGTEMCTALFIKYNLNTGFVQ